MIVSNTEPLIQDNGQMLGQRARNVRKHASKASEMDIDGLISTSLSSLRRRQVLKTVEMISKRNNHYRLAYQRRPAAKLESMDSNIFENTDDCEQRHEEETVHLQVLRCQKEGNLVERLVRENRERQMVGGVVILRPGQTLSSDQYSMAQ